MTKEDLIHQRLNDPDILDIHITEDASGYRIEIEVKGKEPKVRRLTEDHFDVLNVMEAADEPSAAVIRPKW